MASSLKLVVSFPQGAIVAREYGLPAVMSVSGTTKQIQDGQTITVDENKGIVYIGAEIAA